MTTTATASTNVPRPSEDQPTSGVIGQHGVVLSEVEHWFDDDVFVIRSTEFDCYAEDEDFQSAVNRFGETVLDLGTHLAELVSDGRATEHEHQAFDLLAPRLVALLDAEGEERRRHEERLVSINVGRLRRRRRGTGSSWAPRATHSSFSQPSLV
ncbi:MAG: hypothetical protein JWO74_940 [Solirubrobacterales bacterium]|jgi:hypothetical protein|nr:hypothetical protein [Solirubrobacterales bacterium]